MELPANCPPGTYGNVTDADGHPECFDCPVGHFCAGGAAQLRNCTAGTYADAPRMEECISCPAGTYQDELGQEECKPCPFGMYSNTTGAKNCEICPAGSKCVDSIITECAAGTFQSKMGQAECET